MKKEETIERYGEEAYAKKLERERARYNEWQEDHPEEVIAKNQRTHQEQSRKGGKHYDKMLEAQRTGLQGERHRIRINHAKQYKPYKAIIAPDSQIHHEWIPDTSDYRGVALVEKEPHQYGIVDVIEILTGKITLLTEEEVREGKNEKEGLQAG